MLKIIQRWSNNFPEFVKDIADNPSSVSNIVCDFLQEISYTYPCEIEAFELLVDVAYKHNIPLTIVTPYIESMPPLIDFTEEKHKRITMIYIPTFWFKRTYHLWTIHYHLQINLKKNIDIRDFNFGKDYTEFKYSFISTNNIAKQHRCLVMDILAKHNLIEHGAISWRDISHQFDHDRHLYPELSDSHRFGYKYKYWQPKRIFLDFDLSDFSQETVPSQFNESFMQLVTESDDEFVFFTEKTATPILLNKPFLVAGPIYHHRELNRLGFVNYDEIFDYSFDLEPDIETRYEMIVENIKRINSLPKDELIVLYRKIFPKLVFNKQLAMSYVNEIPPELKPILQLLKNEHDYPGPLNIFL